jgi:hypothetical protein
MMLRERVAQIARDQGWKAREEDGKLGLEVPLARGRTQVVWVAEFTDAGLKGLRFITRIGKIAGLGETRFRAALEVNLRLPHGCLAVDGDSMVLTETRRLDAASGDSVEAIGFLARQADAYERLIFGTDTH